MWPSPRKFARLIPNDTRGLNPGAPAGVVSVGLPRPMRPVVRRTRHSGSSGALPPAGRAHICGQCRPPGSAAPYPRAQKCPNRTRRRWLSIMLPWERGSPGSRLRMRSLTRPSSVRVSPLISTSRTNCRSPGWTTYSKDMRCGSPEGVTCRVKSRIGIAVVIEIIEDCLLVRGHVQIAERLAFTRLNKRANVFGGRGSKPSILSPDTNHCVLL